MLKSVMDIKLNVISLLQHAVKKYPESEIVTRRLEGDIHRYNYRQLYQRAGKLANALAKMGIAKEDRIASLAWNTYRHMELYYAVTGQGAIMHTLNPRYFKEQLAFIGNHADISWLFVDPGFEDIANYMLENCPSIKGVVVMVDEDKQPQTHFLAINYEALIKGELDAFNWLTVDENHPCILCYTSGTTGAPKGVLYSHRAMVLHAWASVTPETLDLRFDSVILPMVAMYHAQAWGIPFSAPIVGAKLVLPGNGMSGDAIYELVESEKVNLSLGVPIIWLTLLQYLRDTQQKPSYLKRVCVGGSASPLHLAQAFDQEYGIYWQSLWGMTETGPLATSASYFPAMANMTAKERYQVQISAGRPVYGVEIEIFDHQGNSLPHDGKASGQLRIRGPYIIAQYFRNTDKSAFIDGWLDTGDIATIDQHECLRIVDRKKDVIKSGGEWISSIVLENIASQHPQVDDACVIGVKHTKWEERPLLLLVSSSHLNELDIYAFLQGKIAKWWTPDAIIFVDYLPRNGTGKILKAQLREQYRNYLLENHLC